MRRPSLLGELAVVAFLLFGYDRVAALARVHRQAAIARGWRVLDVEHLLGLGVERTLNTAVAGWRHVDQVLAIYYDFAHSVVTFTVLGLVYVLAAPGYRRARSALLATNLVALVVFVVAPVAPPRLLPGGGFADVVARSHTWGAWESATSSVGQRADAYASTPSLHVAWAVWVVLAVVAATPRRSWRALALVHLLVTVGVVVVTGNHYLVDVLTGGALSACTWIAAARLPGSSGDQAEGVSARGRAGTTAPRHESPSPLT